MKTLALLAVFLLLAVAAVATGEQQVIRFKPRNLEEANRLLELADELHLDVWSENRAKGQIDIRFASVPFSQVASRFSSVEHEVYIADVTGVVRTINMMNMQARLAGALKSAISPSPLDFFQAYHTYDEIMAWLNSTAETYPSLTRLETIGYSVQGNPIVGIHIRSSKGGSNKPMVVYNSLQHAREWISGATTTYIINQLLTGYGKGSQITEMVDSIDWFIVPVVNVDGYLWTWNPQGDRLWRKNRRPLDSSRKCFGIDINRNWGYHFKPSKASLMCDETYAGTVGFSEPENKAIADFLASHPTTVGYIDFHSYSELMMWPWAWQAPPPPHNSDVVGLGNKMVQAIAAVNGVLYTGGQIYEVIYPAYGSSVDFALGVANVTLPYGIELRDTGTYGFLLPPNQIIPNGKEIFSAVETMANYIITNNIRR